MKQLIVLRHPEDHVRTRRSTLMGRKQEQEVSEKIKDKLSDAKGAIGVYSSVAPRTKDFAKTINRVLGLEGDIDVSENLLPNEGAVSYLESSHLPNMIVVTHKEVVPEILLWAADKFDLKVYKEHLRKPCYASGWVISKKGIEPIGPQRYKTEPV